MTKSYDDLLGAEAATRGFARYPAPQALVRVAGPDTMDFLQRLCSQDVAAMPSGRSLPAAFLTGKGKLILTCRVGRIDDVWYVETAADRADQLVAQLDKFHFAERLEFQRLGDWRCGEAWGTEVLAAVGREASICAPLDGGGVVMTGARCGMQWARFHGPADAFATLPWDGAGLGELTDTLAEVLRLCAGIVAVGADTDETTLALEAHLDDHVSTEKGCYAGQEIVARIHTYGHLNRKLCLLELAVPEPVAVGTTLVEPEEGDPVGRIMTSAVLPDGARRVAFGYLPKDFWAAGSELRVGELAGPAVRVVAFAE